MSREDLTMPEAEFNAAAAGETLSPAAGQPTGEGGSPMARRGFRGVARALFNRPLGYLALVGTAVAVVLPPTGIGPSTCGLQTTAGIPCPGCGLTRSVTCFFHGEFGWSWYYHPGGWLFALSFIVLGAVALLPGRWRDPLIVRLSRYDWLLGWMIIGVCALLFVYGLVRVGLVLAGHPDYAWWRDAGASPPFLHDHGH